MDANQLRTNSHRQIRLARPIGFSEQGRREVNQDYIYPDSEAEKLGAGQRLLIVCDGVGGAVRGEEASRLVCEAFAQHLQPKAQAAVEDIRQALRASELSLDHFIEENPEAAGMATTLALLFLNKQDALVAHIGDSRVYQIRDGAILFRTQDHSLISELVASKVITEAEATSHPGRNIISRAVMGSHQPASPEVAVLTDVQAGDYFFLCSDGITESITDEELCALAARADLSDEDKMQLVRDSCQAHSKDNYSAWLAKVEPLPSSPIEALSDEPKSETKHNGFWEQVSAAIHKVLPVKPDNDIDQKPQPWK
jgi:PPM family protein phosphatase